MENAPVFVEATRGDRVESVHRGHLAVVDSSGTLRWHLGDPAVRIFPRSAVKPLQALPLVASGAAAAGQLSDADIALACASHGGTPRHVKLVAAWLARMGLDTRALACGAQPPAAAEARRLLYAAGGHPSALHNNCSGKHCGLLATARHTGVPVTGYIDPEHPVQQGLMACLARVCDTEVTPALCGIDGCGIPTAALPLERIALGMARLATPATLPPDLAAAARRVCGAMTREPALVSWPGQLGDVAMGAGRGALVLKGGAEGVFCAALPRSGLGVALKIADGANRAADVAIVAVLHRLGALDDASATALAPWRPVVLRNRAGTEIGVLRPAGALTGQAGLE